MKLILASASQRRRELLTMLGYQFEICPSDADEHIPLCNPEDFVKALAFKKAQAVFANHTDCCVLGSDTVVVLDGEIIGKPKDAQDALHILRKLSGKTHTVYTGISVISKNGYETDYVTAQVTFANLSDEEIQAYIRTEAPFDKAGAYGIQGYAAIFVEHIEGDYFTIIGLPLQKTYHMLARAEIMPEWL